jgi:hypothetical protein
MLHRFGFLPAKFRWRLANAAAWRRYEKDARRGNPLAKKQFEKRHCYPLNIAEPSTHSERVYLRKLKDHDPRFAQLTDKRAARDVIDERLGAGSVDRLCVPILAHVMAFKDLPLAIWEQDVMLKCTHGSAMNYVVKAGDVSARRRASKKIRKWLGQVHGARRFEWCYFDLEPSIIVEPLLSAGEVRDIKLYFYDGILRWVMPENNNGPVPGITIYTPHWQVHPMRFKGFDHAPTQRPPELSEIIDIATPLAQGYDMVRVDFILTPERFYLGEITLYDGSGLGAFDHYTNDQLFAEHWKQPHLTSEPIQG